MSAPLNPLPRWAAAALFLGLAAATAAVAQAVVPGAPAPPPGDQGFRAGEAFTFLFLSIGPAHAIPVFAGLTAGQQPAFRRNLALAGIGAAALAIAIAATVGVSFIAKWHLSLASIELAAGLLLLLVALGKLLPGATESHAAPAGEGPPPRIADLAFSPIAVPTIIPPFGMAIVILLFALAAERGATVTLAAVVAVILAIDLLAMLYAHKIVAIAWLRYLLLLVGTILGVLQVALALQVIANAIRALNLF